MIFQKAKIVGFQKEVGESSHAFCSKSTSNDHETTFKWSTVSFRDQKEAII